MSVVSLTERKDHIITVHSDLSTGSSAPSAVAAFSLENRVSTGSIPAKKPIQKATAGCCESILRNVGQGASLLGGVVAITSMGSGVVIPALNLATASTVVLSLKSVVIAGGGALALTSCATFFVVRRLAVDLEQMQNLAEATKLISGDVEALTKENIDLRSVVAQLTSIKVDSLKQIEQLQKTEEESQKATVDSRTALSQLTAQLADEKRSNEAQKKNAAALSKELKKYVAFSDSLRRDSKKNEEQMATMAAQEKFLSTFMESLVGENKRLTLLNESSKTETERLLSLVTQLQEDLEKSQKDNFASETQIGSKESALAQVEMKISAEMLQIENQRKQLQEKRIQWEEILKTREQQMAKMERLFANPKIQAILLEINKVSSV